MSFSIITENTGDCAHSSDLPERLMKAANDNKTLPLDTDSIGFVAMPADCSATMDQYK
jgi:hypothetical protein